MVLATALCLVVTGCSKNTIPDTPPPPSGTVTSKVGIVCPFRATASDPDFDPVCVRIDWNNGDTSDWSATFRSGDTITLKYTWPAAGYYRISVQAKDDKGAVSLWSNWHAVTIADTVNIAPVIPSSPAGPDAGFVGTLYDFSDLAVDHNGDRVRLQFDCGDGDTTDWSYLVAESTTITMSHRWLDPGEYSILARAMDEKGLISGWSNVHMMVVSWDTVSRPPFIPFVLVGPDTGYVDSTYEFTTAGGDPNGDSIMFQFDWGDGDTSACSAPVAESAAVRMTHSWTTAGSFAVRARAKDVGDSISGWSAGHGLVVKSSLR